MKLNERQEKIVLHQLELLRLQEKQLFKSDPGNPFNLEIWDTIEEKIPEKAMSALETAFEKGFVFIFDKGNGMIEKAGNFAELKRVGKKNARSIREKFSLETFQKIENNVKKKRTSAKTLSTVEGAALGVFGIGLPDIPVFLGVLFKAIYETAACYGYDYDSPQERAYALCLLQLAAAPDEEKEEYSKACDEIARLIDRGQCPDTVVTEEMIKETSDMMSMAMLVAKFIQGFTILGSIGAAFNYSWMKKISTVAGIKYKERFLRDLADPESTWDEEDEPLLPPG